MFWGCNGYGVQFPTSPLFFSSNPTNCMKTRRQPLLVRDVKPGSVIETLCCGKPTGNIYRVSQIREYGVVCFKAYRGGKVTINGFNECVLIDTTYFNPEF